MWSPHPSAVYRVPSPLQNLLFSDRRRLIVSKINLILSVADGFDNRLDRRIDNLPTVHLHADADFVADFMGSAHLLVKKS